MNIEYRRCTRSGVRAERNGFTGYLCAEHDAPGPAIRHGEIEMREPKFPPMTTFTPLDPMTSATAQLRAMTGRDNFPELRERDLRVRVEELEHWVTGLRGIVENWREAVHSDYGAMAAVEDHLGRVPSPSDAEKKT